MPTKAPVPILVVDDNAAKRLALKAVLSPLGYLIVEADSGQAALRRVMAQDFAVILLDVRMPIMDGFETAALIRLRWQSEMTPIIFITAFQSAEIVYTDRYAEGAVDFIFAPVPAEELRAKVSVFANLFSKAELLATRAREVQTYADQLRLLTDAAPIGIFQTDTENRYVYTNPRWSEITGIPPAEATGQAWDTIIGSQQRTDLLAELGDDALYRAELSHRFELPLPGSAPRIVLVTSRSISDSDGGIAGWVGTLADVTAEARAEAVMADARDKATEASRLKSDFLANMSHEIRTPMNGVIGMTDLLLETDLDTCQRDYAQTVRNSGEALLAIINDILDFSKVEAGMLEVEEVEFNLGTILHDVVDLLAGPAQAKGLELVTVIGSSVPAVVSGDPGRVRQVLTNLVGNAIKFTKTGEVVVRVTEAEVVGTDTYVRFEVSDTGDGIAPDKLAMIFEPFVQADTSTSRRYGGTGLGLAISGQLVALMGGSCGVTSRLGAGSTFWFTIRVQAAAQAAHDPSSPEVGLAGVAVLIVDDNATQRSVLTEYLAHWGMIVSTADSGRAALATLRTAAIQGRPFALALLDRSMPGMDGLELKNAIVADPALTVRVVLMTGLGQERDLDNAAESGVGGSLSKPIHRDNLRACLRIALDLGVADVAPAAGTAPGPSLSGKPAAGRLLLAEDNLVNQRIAVAMLSGAGYRVDTVLNGAAAVQAVAANPYDAILMDCQMPELNGYEATAAIRAQEGSGRHTPIIAMTAGARREDRERCLAEGMDGYLAKPVSKDVLLALVARSVKQGQAVPDQLRPLGGSPEAVTGPGSAGPAPSGHLLLVENNPVSQRVEAAMLETLGFQVDVVADGAEAVNAATLRPYQAILMGCQLPVLDGYQATSEIRRLQGESRHTPIIAVAASAMKANQQRCLAAGMDDYLVKPLELRSLGAVLARWTADGSDRAMAVGPAESLPTTHVGLAHLAVPGGPVLDAEVVDRLERLGKAAGEDLMGQVAMLYLADAGDRIVALREALAADDAAAVNRSAHALRGASANLGATNVARLCATLEGDSAAGDLQGAEALLEAIGAELERVRLALGSPIPVP